MKKTKLARTALVMTVLFILFTLVACSPGGTGGTGGTGGSKPKSGGVLRVIENSEGAAPLGVPWEVDGIDIKLLHPTLEGLMRDDLNGELHPHLAESYEVDLDAMTITFKLKKGIKFHDGSDFNAEAVAFSHQPQIDLGRFPGYKSIEVIDDYTIVYHLESYFNTQLGTLAVAKIISKKSFEEKGIEWARDNPVGTGPFKLESLERGSTVKYVRNEEYWQEGMPYLDGIEILLIRDVMTQQAAMISTGEDRADAVALTSAEQASTMESQGLKVLGFPVGPISLIPGSKIAGSPLANPKVRIAISHAIDREGIVASRGFDIWEPAYQLHNPTSGAFIKDFKGHEFDLVKAKALMKEAGYENGFATKIYVMPGLVDRDAMVAIQSQLAQIGVTVELVFPDAGGYSSIRFGGWDEGFLAQHTRSLFSYNQTFNFYFREDIQRYQFPSMKRPDGFAAALKASLSTPDLDNEKGSALTKMFNDEAAIIPIYYVYEMYLTQQDVKDSGFGEWGSSTAWTPEKAWLDR